MIRILISLTVGGMLTLLNTYPAFSEPLPDWEIRKSRKQQFSSNNNILVKGINSGKQAPAIKRPEEALTLSRFSKDGHVHTLAVLEDDGIHITGIDLSAELKRYDRNSFDVIRNLTFDEVVKIIRTTSNKVIISHKDLLPSVAGREHLAIGINYAEHGKETGQVKPFMFPKFVSTDPAIHQLPYTRGWLLDHEVELGIAFPTAVCSVADINHMMVGFLVVNDFTDRATLMQKMDSRNVTGGKGFPDAKSKKGFLPTGPYIVVPKDWRAFVKELHLQLSVNGHIRQSGSAKDMVWNIDKIIEQSLAVKGKIKSYYQGKMVKLFEGNCIPANSIIITGTPSGVVFNAPTKGFIFGAVMKYIFTGGFFRVKMHPYILQQYLKKEYTNPRYLKPGDFVESSISFLGTIKTSIKD
ncbi:fumarylacetoacetate hydrolase family protein [Mucilaginibacter sp. Bleaf8]|uniref:fumarylacetoacetate hydrolase family protein n=1 Tax=Mucilaginibacter sp. Bleaf8 TaxID=2834430 RepID=UPI001BD00065|nr:fumarylacetoacetate hydrolase family protein [Mucilaginibacter sp. Bleaf8]MBS7563012.1 fumarylacetoacetate hydrolase family protein [Mucilaginibacter sp. Bleaf8]